jgi:Uncharacterized protein conserved in bacteria (DUF2332)
VGIDLHPVDATDPSERAWLQALVWPENHRGRAPGLDRDVPGALAAGLGSSPKTCDHHIQHLYGKAGGSTRAGATLFALEHVLVRPDETALR